jgi:hypothetical protein
MKSYIQLECSENTLSLMPCRIKNIKELKYDIPKDLNQIVTESENKNV